MARRRNKFAGAMQSAASADMEFERELEIFRTEAETAAQFLYAFLAIHASAATEKAVHRRLSATPLFWKTILGGLQTAAFVALGRIFDQDTPHNVNRLLRLAQDNPQIFSKAALAQRKQGPNHAPPAWLNNYLKDVYLPRPTDWQRLRGYVSKQRKIYFEKYRPLRHKVFGHKVLSDPEAVSALFAKTNIREMQRMVVFLMALYAALWQLFMNGARPVLRPQRYSVNRMRERASKNLRRGGSVLERLVHEAERFLIVASRHASTS
jgi:hypothetical protein